MAVVLALAIKQYPKKTRGLGQSPKKSKKTYIHNSNQKTHIMNRSSAINILKQQKAFKKAVIEMLEYEIGIIEKESAYHQEQIDSGNTEILETDIFQDKTNDDPPFN